MYLHILFSHELPTCTYHRSVRLNMDITQRITLGLIFSIPVLQQQQQQLPAPLLLSPILSYFTYHKSHHIIKFICFSMPTYLVNRLITFF